MDPENCLLRGVQAFRQVIVRQDPMGLAEYRVRGPGSVGPKPPARHCRGIDPHPHSVAGFRATGSEPPSASPRRGPPKDSEPTVAGAAGCDYRGLPVWALPSAERERRRGLRPALRRPKTTRPPFPGYDGQLTCQARGQFTEPVVGRPDEENAACTKLAELPQAADDTRGLARGYSLGGPEGEIGCRLEDLGWTCRGADDRDRRIRVTPGGHGSGERRQGGDAVAVGIGAVPGSDSGSNRSGRSRTSELVPHTCRRVSSGQLPPSGKARRRDAGRRPTT